jgi:hypothetical protein
MPMTPKEVESFLREHSTKRLRATFADGIVQYVDIHSVDDEGFLHSGADGEKPANFWTRFEDVTELSFER